MSIYIPNTNLSSRDAANLSTRRTVIDVVEVGELPAGMQFDSCKFQCIPKMIRFTDEIGIDGLKNDFTALFVNTFKGANVEANIINTETGVEYPLVNDDYGKIYSFALPNLAWGYRIDWFKVWDVLGYGSYKFTIQVKNIVGTVISEFESICFALIKYADEAANGTVRIETIQTGKLAHGNNYKDLVTTGGDKVDWVQQWRVFGALMLSGMTRENHRIQKTSRSSLQIKDEIVPEYDLRIKRIAFSQVNSIIFDGMFANLVKVVDYNVFNFENFKEIELYNETIETGETTKDRKRKTFIFKMVIDKQNIFKTNN